MGLDIRLPIGAMFALLGLLLVIYGLVTSSNSQAYARSLHININLWWGIIMLAFGLVMLVLSRRGGKVEGARLAEDSPEGRATEAREHRLGIEKDR